MEEKTKSCPFCGAIKVEIIRTNRQACWVRCYTCGAESSSSPSREQALENWNTRIPAIPATIYVDDDANWGKCRTK